MVEESDDLGGVGAEDWMWISDSVILGGGSGDDSVQLVNNIIFQ